MIIKSLFYGILSAAGATIFQQVVLIFNMEAIDTSHLTPLLIFGALSEEIFKLIFIYRLKLDIENKKSFLIGSLLIGLGFSLVELIFKTWDNWEKLLHPDYFGVALIHIITAGIIGLFIAQKWNIYLKIILGISIAFALHIIYNSLQIYIF